MVMVMAMVMGVVMVMGMVKECEGQALELSVEKNGAFSVSHRHGAR